MSVATRNVDGGRSRSFERTTAARGADLECEEEEEGE